MFSENLYNFLNEVKMFQQDHLPHRVWYRGQGCDKPLNSGLFRIENLSIQDIKTKERIAFYMFRNFGQSLLDKESDWELLNIMQHYGVKTRLLDWTRSLLTAIYFALQTDYDSPVLWMLSPNKMNKILINDDCIATPPFNESYEKGLNDELPIPTSIAIHPTKNSLRQSVQQGFFTVQSDNLLPLEKEKDEILINSGVLKKIKISEDLIKDLKWYLELNSINHFSIYPDLFGLSKNINKDVFGL